MGNENQVKKVSMLEVRSFFKLPAAKPGRRSELEEILDPTPDKVTLSNSQVRFLQKAYFLLKGKKLSKEQLEKLNELASKYSLIFEASTHGYTCKVIVSR